MLLLSILSALAHDHHRQPIGSHQAPSIVVARGSLSPFSPFPLRELGYPLVIHRIERDCIPCEKHPHKQSFVEPDTSKESKAAESWGWLAGKVLLLLVFMGVAGAVGFYLGKINESRNYVRVPSMN